jgi:hypothetical protein
MKQTTYKHHLQYVPFSQFASSYSIPRLKCVIEWMVPLPLPITKWSKLHTTSLAVCTVSQFALSYLIPGSTNILKMVPLPLPVPRWSKLHTNITCGMSPFPVCVILCYPQVMRHWMNGSPPITHPKIKQATYKHHLQYVPFSLFASSYFIPRLKCVIEWIVPLPVPAHWMNGSPPITHPKMKQATYKHHLQYVPFSLFASSYFIPRLKCVIEWIIPLPVPAPRWCVLHTTSLAVCTLFSICVILFYPRTNQRHLMNNSPPNSRP